MAEVCIGLGSNHRRLAALRWALAQLHERYGPLRLSGLYESPDAEGAGPAYLNLVACLRCEREPAALKQELRALEARAGRRREDRVCELDLDLLLYGDRLEPGPPLLPHPQLLARDDLLAALAEVVPERRDPGSGRRFVELWAQSCAERGVTPPPSAGARPVAGAGGGSGGKGVAGGGMRLRRLASGEVLLGGRPGAAGRRPSEPPSANRS